MVKSLIFSSLLAATGLLWADSAEGHLQAAEKLLRRGRVRDAREELLVAQRLAPQRNDVAQLLASLETGAAPLTGSAATLDLSASAGADAAPTPEAGVRSKVEAALAQARSAYRESDLKGAAEAWRRALQLQDGEREASEGLERLEREAYHRDADQPFDSSVSDLYDAAMREARKGRLVEAKRKLEEAQTLNPMQPQVKAELAELAGGAQQQQAGRDAEQWVLEGRRALKEKDWAKAGKAFQEALKQAPNMNAAREGLAEVRAQGAAQAGKALQDGQGALDQGRWEEAERQFSLALALDPESEEAQEGRRAAQQRAVRAQNVASQRHEADRLYNAGVDAWGQGDLGLAASRFREVLKLVPGDPEAQKALAAVRRKLDERVEKDRGDAQRLVEEGRNLEAHGAPEEALKRYQRALAKDPSQNEAAAGQQRLLAEIKAP
jgi:tetratricopeptide (TPR) repeat protein